MEELSPINSSSYPFNEVIPNDEKLLKKSSRSGEPSPFIERSKKLKKKVEKEDIKTIEDYDEYRRKPRFSVCDKKPGNYFLIRMQKAHEHRENQIDHHLWEYEKKEEEKTLIKVSTKTMRFEADYEYIEPDRSILNIELIEPNRNFSSGFAKDLESRESKYLPSYSPKRLLSPPRSPNSTNTNTTTNTSPLTNNNNNNNNNNIITINLQRTTPILHYEPIDLSLNLDENPRFLSKLKIKKENENIDEECEENEEEEEEEENEKEYKNKNNNDNKSDYSNEGSVTTGVIKKYNGCLPQLSLTMKRYMEENNLNHIKYESLIVNKMKETNNNNNNNKEIITEIPMIDNSCLNELNSKELKELNDDDGVEEELSELNKSYTEEFELKEYYYETNDSNINPELNSSEIMKMEIPEYHYEEMDESKKENNEITTNIEIPSEIIHTFTQSKFTSKSTTTTTPIINNEFIPSNTVGGITQKADDEENIEILPPSYGLPTTTTICNSSCVSPITMKNNYFNNNNNNNNRLSSSSSTDNSSIYSSSNNNIIGSRNKNKNKKVKPAPTYIQTVKRMLKSQKKVVSLDAFYRERSRLVMNIKLPHCDESFNIRLFEIKDYNGLLQLIYSDKFPQYYYAEYVNMKKASKYWVIEAYQPNNEYVEIIHNESTFKTAIKQYELMKWSKLYLRVLFKHNESSIIKSRLPEPLNLDPDYPRYERPFDSEVQNIYLDGSNLKIPLSPNFKQPIILPPNHVHYPYVNEDYVEEEEEEERGEEVNNNRFTYNNNDNNNQVSQQSLMERYSSPEPLQTSPSSQSVEPIKDYKSLDTLDNTNSLDNLLPPTDSVEVKISRSLCVTLSDVNSSSQYEENIVPVSPPNLSKSTIVSPSKRYNKTANYSPPPAYTHGFSSQRNGVQSSPALIPRTRYAELYESSAIKPAGIRRKKFSKTVGVPAPSKIPDPLPTISDMADSLTRTNHPYSMYQMPTAADQVLIRNSPFSQYSAKLPAPCDRKIMESIQDFYFFNHKEKFKYPFRPKNFLPPLTSLLSPAKK